MPFSRLRDLAPGLIFSSNGRAALKARALRFLRFQNMLNELSLKKTPLVAALGAALAVSVAAPVWAAEDEKPADPTPTEIDGNDASVWEAEKDVPSYVVSGKDGSKIVVSGDRNVTARGTGSVVSLMTVKDTGRFTNQSRSNLTFEGGSTLTIDLTGSSTGEDNAKTGSFVNRGTVTLQKGDHSIKGDAIVQEDPEKKLALPTITMGDVVVTGEGAVLTNKNKGYVVKVKEPPKEEGADPTYKDDTRTLVSFDQLTLEKGGRFVNAEGARETGDALYVADSSSSAEINGTSEWDTVTINLDDPKDDTEEKPEGEKAAGDPAITVADKAHLSVTEGLTIRGNAGTEAKSVFGDIVAVGEQAEDATESLVTIDGTLAFAHEGTLTLAPVDGVDISGVAIDLDRAFTDEELGGKWARPKDEGMSSKLEITGFGGTLTEIPPETEEGEDGDKGDAATRAEGDEGSDADKPTHTWSAARFGAISVDGVSTIKLSTAAIETGNEKLDESKSDLFSTGERVALRTGNFTFTETWAKGKAVEWEKKEDSASGKADGDAGEGGDEKTVLEKVDEKLSQGVADLVQEISNAQLRVDGGFGVLKGETRTVTFDFDENGNFLESTDGYESVANSTSENEFQKSKQNILVKDSRLQASGLYMQSGSLTMTNSDVTFGVLPYALNGAVEFQAGEKGNYLGLGWLPTAEERKGVLDYIAEEKLPSKATVFVGQTIVLDKDGSLVLGKTTSTGSAAAAGEGEGDKEKNNASLTLGENAWIVVDTASFARGPLFASNLEKGRLTIEEGATIDARNLTWGTYQLFENLETAEGAANTELEVEFDSKASVQSHWLVNLSEAETDKVEADYDPAKGWIKVGMKGADGALDSSVEALHLQIDAANLANNVFVKGERNTTYGDVAFITRAMGLVGTQIAGPKESASGASALSTTDADGRVFFDANDFAKTMNLATSFAAAAAVKALTVDFNSYTVDQIEHHAATIPHEMRGWWVQPIASKMKTDDLAAGSLTAGYSLDTVGIMGGYDFTVPNGDIWGIAASYQSGDADGEGDVQSMTTDITNYGFHLWAARHYGDLKVMGTLSYMVTDGDADMSIDRMGRLSATDISAKAFAFGVNGALTKAFGPVTIVPHAGARAMMIDVDDITATYQGAEAFRFRDDTSWVFEVPVGATFKTAFEYQRWNVQPYVDLTVRGRFGDTDGSYTVTGASQGGSDTIDYDVTGSFVGDVKLGYMSTFKDLNLGMSYGFSAGDAGRQNHTLEATMRIDL